MIKYKKREYKYQLVEPYLVKIPITGYDISDVYFSLDNKGHLSISSLYAWDGPSGPTWDTKNFMRGSLIHDVLYQMMRMEMLPTTLKDTADRILQTVCKEDGMSSIRASYVYWAVKHFAHYSCKPGSEDKVLTAP